MDLDFNSDFIEEMILKKATTDKKYLSVLSNVFDIRWWKNKNVGVLLDLSVLYFRKYSAVPSTKILQALLQKVRETPQTPPVLRRSAGRRQRWCLLRVARVRRSACARGQ